MLKEILEVQMKGHATFEVKDKKGRIKRSLKIKNAIQPAAKDITARRLIAHPTSVIDTISLYLLGNLVFAQAITSTGIVSDAQVFFETTFLPGDFNGDFDAARLTASGLADFSVIGNLVGSKDNTESLLVTWNIQIN